MARNEDLPYINVEDSALPEDKHEDPDQPNKSVLREVAKYFNEAIEANNTFDVIDLSDSVLTPTQQIAVRKQVIAHLRDVKSMVDDKLRELQ